MRKRAEDPGINMTPMIDVVFQLIIFFVCTTDLAKKALDENIKLAMAPHGRALEQKDPREVVIELDEKGRISITRNYMDINYLSGILRKLVADYGQSTPVVIRADGRTKHQDVKLVMDACSRSGLWKIKFAALKELAGTSGGS
jgi:biopolymer transport protein ExbD